MIRGEHETWSALEAEIARLKKENVALRRLAEEDCTKCLYMNEDSSGEHCGKCTHNYVSWYKPMTNGQRLRTLSDHDLAELLSVDCGICGHACANTVVCNKDDCVKRIEMWLTSPVENQR